LSGPAAAIFACRLRQPELRRVLSDPSVTVIVVEHRYRLAPLGAEALDVALAAAAMIRGGYWSLIPARAVMI
jgi:predicted site-specific integrase-resolvase